MWADSSQVVHDSWIEHAVEETLRTGGVEYAAMECTVLVGLLLPDGRSGITALTPSVELSVARTCRSDLIRRAVTAGLDQPLEIEPE